MYKSTITLAELISEISTLSAAIATIEPNLDTLEAELETGTYLGWSEAFNERVKCRCINTWTCTDTLVGLNAYYLDNEFVAFSFQSARKSDIHFYWVSLEIAKRVKTFILELSGEDQLKITLISDLKELPPSWLS